MAFSRSGPGPDGLRGCPGRENDRKTKLAEGTMEPLGEEGRKEEEEGEVKKEDDGMETGCGESEEKEVEAVVGHYVEQTTRQRSGSGELPPLFSLPPAGPGDGWRRALAGAAPSCSPACLRCCSSVSKPPPRRTAAPCPIVKCRPTCCSR